VTRHVYRVSWLPYALPAVCLDISSAEAQLGQVHMQHHSQVHKKIQREEREIYEKPKENDITGQFQKYRENKCGKTRRLGRLCCHDD
jgi:hypothetical protein